MGNDFVYIFICQLVAGVPTEVYALKLSTLVTF